MTFGEKVKHQRLSANLSQSDLAKKTGISERSLYAYEQGSVLPRSGNAQKIADALGVSLGYLLGEEPDPRPSGGRDLFFNDVRREFGPKGVREAREVLSRVSALFAGGELDDAEKDVFFQSLMEVYLESKTEAREKFSNRRVKRKKNGGE